MKRLFTALVLLFIGSAANAQDYDDWYEVEVILFEHLNPDALHTENWPVDPGSPDMKGLVELITQKPEPDLESTGESELILGEEFSTALEPLAAEELMPAVEASQVEAFSPELEAIEETTEEEAREPLPFELLPAELLQLTEEYEKLDTSPAYQPLLHLSWRQIIQGRHRPDHIHLFTDLDKIPEEDELAVEGAEEELPLSEEMEQPSIPEPISPSQEWALDAEGNVINIPLAQHRSYIEGEELPELDDLLLEEMAEPPLPMDGVLTLSRGRYIHVELDLLWRLLDEADKTLADEDLDSAADAPYLLPLPFEQNIESKLAMEELFSEEAVEELTPVDTIRIRGNLRMRSGEIHYLDHPMVGMLILFTPYAPPMDEDEKESTDSVETFAIDQ